MGRTWIPIVLGVLVCCQSIGAQAKDNPDESALEKAGVKLEDASLLDFFNQRTFRDADRSHFTQLVRELSSPEFETRQHASKTLTAAGLKVLDFLRAELRTAPDLESRRRIELVVKNVFVRDFRTGLAAAAVRVLRAKNPPRMVETLLDYLPSAEDEGVVEEIRATMANLAVEDGKPHPKLVDALQAKSPILRAMAGESLWKSRPAEIAAEVEKTLADPDPFVRYRVALAALKNQERKAGPTLIATLAELPLDSAWQVEDLLLRLAVDKSPPPVSLGPNEKTRITCRDGWLTWWKEHGAKVDLTAFDEFGKLRGYTTVVLLDEGKILDLGADNHVRWRIDGLMFPLDVQVLDDQRVLVAEYHARRVTERRTSDGGIIWSKPVEEGPLVAQRLHTGNTFVATDQHLFEFDKTGNEVWHLDLSEDEDHKILKAMKLLSGEIACLRSDGRIVRLNAKGKEVSSFEVNLGTRLYGGRIQMLPTGRVLLPHNAEDKVVEYDSRGKAVWEVAVEKPIAALRLSNGNTLVTSMLPAIGAVEFNRFGQEVWSYRQSTRVTRAMRR